MTPKHNISLCIEQFRWDMTAKQPKNVILALTRCFSWATNSGPVPVGPLTGVSVPDLVQKFWQRVFHCFLSFLALLWVLKRFRWPWLVARVVFEPEKCVRSDICGVYVFFFDEFGSNLPNLLSNSGCTVKSSKLEIFRDSINFRKT